MELLPNSPNGGLSLDEISMRAGLLSDNDEFVSGTDYKEKYRKMIGTQD